MNRMAAVVVTGLAVALAGAAPARLASMQDEQDVLLLADMGMGDLGPQLGGSQDDMIVTDPGHVPVPDDDDDLSDPGHVPVPDDDDLSDPGHVPREADMFIDDPGHLPPQAEMVIQPQRDLDLQDDISE